MHLLSDIQQAAADKKLLETTALNLQEWLKDDFLPPWAQASIAELVAEERWAELDNRFFKVIAFGTGGMRGRTIGYHTTRAEAGPGGDPAQGPAHPAVGSACLNDVSVVRATIGLYRYCARHLAETGLPGALPRLVIAHDVRFFSHHFSQLAASTWVRLGGQAMVFAGPRSTPQLSFTVRHVQATAGIVITASHNPPHDNGYKVYFADGAQVVSPQAEGIIGEVRKVRLPETAPYLTAQPQGIVVLPPKVDEAYLKALEENILDAAVLKAQRPKVVFTPIHGTGAVASVPLLEKLGVAVVTVPAQMVADGRFPTVKSPNPENAEALALGLRRADETGADVVIATDPDSDRMGVAVRDANGQLQLLTGNMIGSLLAEYRVQRLKEMGVLPAQGSPRAALIKTFVTTPLQAAIGQAHGLKVVNCLTGFKWIGAKLRAYEQELAAKLAATSGLALDYDRCSYLARARLLLEHSTFYVFGGEESYGYLASDLVRDKDANAATAMFCEMVAWLQARGDTVLTFLDRLYLKYGYYLEQLVNLYYEGASGAQKIAKIIASYRSQPPKQLGEYLVTSLTDFGKQDVFDADHALVPKEDFYFLELDNGYSLAIRGSGTEPKAKVYLFAREDVPCAADLAEVKATTRTRLQALAAAIEADAKARAEA